MTDIAQLGYSVDSSQLAQGTVELNKHTAAAAKTGAASEKLAKQTDRLALSEKQLIAAQRQLPMQFTDIVTGLASGQKPMQVLIQQGGQLKDVFGGVGPALRATAGYIAGLINPITLLGAAGVALFAAWESGASEEEDFNAALILTGGYADITADQAKRLAEEMDNLSGVTEHKAMQALTAFAASGRFAGEALAEAAEAAAVWEDATGTAIDDTLKQFEKIEKDPVKALLELNRSYHFLTQAQLDHITQLKEEGREADAAAEATKIYAEVLKDRSQQLIGNLGAIESAWRGVKGIAAEAWDSMLAIGRDDTISSRILQAGLLASQFSGLNGLIARGRKGSASTSDLVEAALKDNDRTLSLVDSDEAEKQIKARKEWDKLVLSNLSKQEKLEHEIADIKKAGLAAGKSEADIEKQIAQARARYKDSLPKGRKAPTDPTDALIKRLREQIALNEEAVQADDRLTATERLLVQVRTELDRIGAKGSETNKKLIADLLEQARASGVAVEAAERQRKEEEALARLRERTSLAEQNQKRSNEIDLMGIGHGSEATEMLRRQLDLQRWYEDQVLELQRQATREKRDVTAGEEQELKDSLQRQLDAERSYQEERRRLMGDWSVGATKAFEDYIARANDVASQTNEIFGNAFQGLEDTLVDFITTGKASFSDLLNSIAADITRFVVRQQLSKLMQSLFSGSGNATAFGADSYGGGGFWSGLVGALFGGGLAGGGDVFGGQYYRVGEGDRPELLNMGRGRQFLIPGDQGRVEPIGSTPAATQSGLPPQNIYLQGRPTRDTARQMQIEAARRQRVSTARFGG